MAEQQSRKYLTSVTTEDLVMPLKSDKKKLLTIIIMGCIFKEYIQ